MAQFNTIFGFPTDGINWNVPDFKAHNAWHELTGQHEYDPSKSKASFLRNHALRYIHRVMASSIFGRGESTGVVNKVELLFLWAMNNRIQVNTGAWFLKHLMHVARSSTGKICIGGLLSVIANAYDFVPVQDVHHIIPGSHLVDIDTLLNMKMCKHIGGGQFRLLDAGGQVIEPDEDDPYDVPQDDAPIQDEEHDYVGDFPDPTTEAHYTAGQSSSDWNMTHIIERLERLEASMGHSDERQIQMMASLQRIEEKLSRMK